MKAPVFHLPIHMMLIMSEGFIKIHPIAVGPTALAYASRSLQLRGRTP